MDIISDKQISEYIKEKKILPSNFTNLKLNFKERPGQYYFEQEINGLEGTNFKIIVRRSKINPLDFSVILAIIINGVVLNLKRYNGDSHTHKNQLENESMDGFHIHKATERYQEKGLRLETYAEKTTKYNDWLSALKLMISQNNFEIEVPSKQKKLGSEYE